MSNIQPAYVTFEQAKMLKEKGFNLEVFSYFKSKESVYNDFPYYEQEIDDWNSIKYNAPHWPDTYSRPEQWQVVEWLRVNHGIWIDVTWGTDNEKEVWYFGVSKINVKSPIMTKPYFDTPQEAYTHAFDYVLKELI